MNDEEEIFDLSDEPTGESVCRLIGRDRYNDFCLMLGGRRLYIPKNPGKDSPISVSMGLEAAIRVCAIYGGMMFDVPLNSRKHEEIRELDARGLSAVEIAHKIRVTRQTVMRVIKKPQPKEEPNLFNSPEQ